MQREFKAIIDMIASAAESPLNYDCIRLLGQDRLQFSLLFDRLDADRDGLLNAAELRGFFSFLFGDPVSTEHLLHFENRYLLQYGEEGGGLSKDAFMAILEDYESSYGYSISDDIREFYFHFVSEEEPRIPAKDFVQHISTVLSCEVRPDSWDRANLTYLQACLLGNSKSGSGEITLETFRQTLGEIFRIGGHQLAASHADTAMEDSTVQARHPFYRAHVEQRASRFVRIQDGQEYLTVLQRLAQEEMSALAGRRSEGNGQQRVSRNSGLRQERSSPEPQ